MFSDFCERNPTFVLVAWLFLILGISLIISSGNHDSSESY